MLLRLSRLLHIGHIKLSNSYKTNKL